MPIVRLSRDKRGTDTVYLIDIATDGRKAGRSRVLYFWTAPPGLRVGRDVFDAERRRAIESAHPSIDFAWDDLLRSLELARQQAPAPGALPRREAWRSARAARSRQRAAEALSVNGQDGGSAVPDGAASDTEVAVGAIGEAPAPAEEASQAAETSPGAPASADDESSEQPAWTGTRRRRRRRSRRPAAGTPSPSADL